MDERELNDDEPGSRGGPGFIKMIRNPHLFDLLVKDQKAFRLLVFVAFTTNRERQRNMYGSNFGEAYVTANSCGLSSQEFASARKRLEKIGCATFETRGRGRNQDVYGRLLGSSMFDLNLEGNSKLNAKRTHFKGNSLSIQSEVDARVLESENKDPVEEFEDANSNSKAMQSPSQTHLKSPNKQELRKNKEEKRKEDSPSSSKKRTKQAQVSDKGLELAEKLFRAIEISHPGIAKPSSFDAWAKDIDRLMRIDGKNEATIQAVIEFLPRDSFWCKNVLSGAKLRKHFGKLEAAKFEKESINTHSKGSLAAKVAWAKETCRPFLKSPKALFIFRHDHVEVLSKQKDSEPYKVYFNAKAFEEIFTNTLRKVGVL